MIVNHIDNLESNKITHPDAKNAFMKVLVSEKEGWNDYVMRVVEVEENGFTPKHNHPWPHINYVIEGQGHIMIEGKLHPVKQGSYAYVPSDAIHQFRNTGKTMFKFICIVPKEGHR
ncbi:cupin domain-containing protein [Hujiaoplasma nucleasis]|uniref:Cupin domain-containing protein n=1 Tax=Hujiaoplasma nucleasis TaxID=2725268 RepID=A0A7L6N5N1_9MOLU|nr:cupin domain-containing protein [Hujiaoplasma nucleasis]QLY40871.1 cupin domain-containing protein [Hujiaoplasma nucleasis]